jgi:hypothetical protein
MSKSSERQEEEISQLFEVTSTRDQLEDFIGSFVWKDMVELLKMWEEGLVPLYDQSDSLIELGRIQGRREAINYLLEAPHFLLGELDYQKEMKNGL